MSKPPSPSTDLFTLLDIGRALVGAFGVLHPLAVKAALDPKNQVNPELFQRSVDDALVVIREFERINQTSGSTCPHCGAVQRPPVKDSPDDPTN